MDLPARFCWTKFGTEAGESASTIRERKEFERANNNGIFLWGIGNSIRPSLSSILEHTAEPAIIFTPMLSSPSKKDASPTSLVLWTSAIGINGEEFPIPTFSTVTSRGGTEATPRAHYALVCRSEENIERDGVETRFQASSVRNLRGGSVVGSSQVTSVVARINANPTLTPEYVVAFRAILAFPFLVKLKDPIDLPKDFSPTLGCKISQSDEPMKLSKHRYGHIMAPSKST